MKSKLKLLLTELWVFTHLHGQHAHARDEQSDWQHSSFHFYLYISVFFL